MNGGGGPRDPPLAVTPVRDLGTRVCNSAASRSVVTPQVRLQAFEGRVCPADKPAHRAPQASCTTRCDRTLRRRSRAGGSESGSVSRMIFLPAPCNPDSPRPCRPALPRPSPVRMPLGQGPLPLDSLKSRVARQETVILESGAG